MAPAYLDEIIVAPEHTNSTCHVDWHVGCNINYCILRCQSAWFASAACALKVGNARVWLRGEIQTDSLAWLVHHYTENIVR